MIDQAHARPIYPTWAAPEWVMVEDEHRPMWRLIATIPTAWFPLDAARAIAMRRDWSAWMTSRPLLAWARGTTFGLPRDPD